MPASSVPSLLPVAASLLAVIALIFALGWVLRRMPLAGRAGAGALRIRGALAVGARERVLWIEAAGKHLLIGVTQQSVRTLHEFGEAPAEPPSPPSSGFADHLRRALGKAPQ